MGAFASTVDVFIMRGGSGEVGTGLTATNQVLATVKRTKLFLSEREGARGLVGHVIHHRSGRARDSRASASRRVDTMAVNFRSIVKSKKTRVSIYATRTLRSAVVKLPNLLS